MVCTRCRPIELECLYCDHRGPEVLFVPEASRPTTTFWEGISDQYAGVCPTCRVIITRFLEVAQIRLDDLIKVIDARAKKIASEMVSDHHYDHHRDHSSGT